MGAVIASIWARCCAAAISGRLARATFLVFSCALPSCASPPPTTAPPAIASAAPTIETAPPVAPRVSLGPGEIVCGVDDGPVPIGRDDDHAPDDLRTPADRTLPVAAAPPPTPRDVSGRFLGEMAAEPPEPLVGPAKPEVKLAWTLAPGLAATPAFEERARACSELASPEDTGERTFAVQTSAGGGPVASRVEGDHSSSKLTICFATALCALGLGGGANAHARSGARLRTEITPPVFRGSVRVAIADQREGNFAPHDRFGRRRVLSSARPRSPAAQAYAEGLAQKVRPGAEACARATPPDQSFATTVTFAWGPGGAKLLPAWGRERNPFLDAFDACLAKAAAPALSRPPPGFNPGNRIPVEARLDIRPPGPGPSPGNP